MPAPRREPAADDLARWAKIRADARRKVERLREAERAARDSGPDPARDLVGAIAWRSQFREEPPYDETLRGWINRARSDQRLTFREIASATTGDADNHGREQARQWERNARSQR